MAIPAIIMNLQTKLMFFIFLFNASPITTPILGTIPYFYPRAATRRQRPPCFYPYIKVVVRILNIAQGSSVKREKKETNLTFSFDLRRHIHAANRNKNSRFTPINNNIFTKTSGRCVGSAYIYTRQVMQVPALMGATWYLASAGDAGPPRR